MFAKYYSFILFFFGVSLYTSKSGLSLFFAFSVISLLFHKPSAQELLILLKKKYLLLALLAIGPLAFLANLLSQGGLSSALEGLKQWPYFLMVLPTLYIYQNQKFLKPLAYGALLGLFIAVSFSFYKLITLPGVFDYSAVRIASFWDIGRWGTFTAVTSLFIFPFVFSVKPLKTKLILSLFLALSLIFLVLSNTRAPLLFSALILVVMSFFVSRNKLIAILILTLMSSTLLLFPKVQQRIAYSLSLKKEPPQSQNQSQSQTTDMPSEQTALKQSQVTASDPSTAGRLHMWKVALDFWKSAPLNPTGFENYEAPLKRFLETQSESYKKLNLDLHFSYRDTHSSYLFFLLQLGLFFSLYFWGVIFIIVMRSLPTLFSKKMIFKSEMEKSFFLASFFIVGFHLTLGLVYSSFVSYESITLFPFLVGLVLLKPNKSINE